MKYVARCSFGKDSLATVLLALIHGEPLDAVIYCEVMFDENTSGEVPEHKDFIYNTAIPWIEANGIKVHVIRSNKTYLDCFYHVIKRAKNAENNGKYAAFPIGGRCAINRDCKAAPMDKFRKAIGSEVVFYNGIAIDESERLERMKKAGRISLLEKYGYTEAMAADLCKQYGLYSPLYNYSVRGGCWFCPNCRMSEFAEFKRRHPDLWQRLLDLGKTENMVSKGFRYSMTIEEVDEEISMQAAQMRLFD